MKTSTVVATKQKYTSRNKKTATTTERTSPHTQKQVAPAAQIAPTGSESSYSSSTNMKNSSKSSTNDQTAAPNHRQKQQQQQKQHGQQEKQHTTRKASAAAENGKNSTKSNKRSATILRGQKRQGCVFHTTSGARRPECG